MSYYPVNLDKIRNFRYGMRAISLVEKKFKKPISKIDMENMTMEDAATLIWAGLVHEDKELTPEKVMDLIDEHSSLPVVAKAMNKALQDDFGGEEEIREEVAEQIKNILEEKAEEILQEDKEEKNE